MLALISLLTYINTYSSHLSFVKVLFHIQNHQFCSVNVNTHDGHYALVIYYVYFRIMLSLI